MKYFTSDLHLGHTLLAQLRGFASVEQHDDAVLRDLNEHVSRNDELYLLGDFSWVKPQKYRQKITCRHIVFIMGNHDKPLASKQTFGDTHKIHITKVCDQQTILSHYPIAYWHNCHHGSFHLYGHVHGKKEEILDNIWPGRRSTDVGVDFAFRVFGDYRPFNEVDIHKVLSIQPGHDTVEGHRM